MAENERGDSGRDPALWVDTGAWEYQAPRAHQPRKTRGKPVSTWRTSAWSRPRLSPFLRESWVAREIKLFDVYARVPTAILDV